MNLPLLAAVAAGGAIGSVGRYLTASALGHLVGTAFPWGTLAVNVVGGLAIGALAELTALRWSVTPELRGFLITGILGGYTTFSAFSLEVVEMVERGAWLGAGAYIAASVTLSLGATLLGMWAMRGIA
jgi:CrcB protein